MRVRTFFESRLHVSVHPQDVLRDESVSLVVDVVGDDEKEVETGEERVGEGDVLVRVLVHVVLSVDGVGGSDNGASSIERRVDSSFGDGDSLLFHNFVNGDSINLGHFIEFINTDNSSISQDHCSSF